MTTEQLRVLLDLTADKEGRITAEGVVKAARDKDHPVNAASDPTERLSAEFDFDVKQSAYRDWVRQARDIIQRVPVYNRVHRHGGMKVPNYVRDPQAPKSEQGYVSLGSVRRASADARLIMVGELDRVVSALNRALGISGQVSSADVESDLTKALTLVSAIRERLLPAGKDAAA